MQGQTAAERIRGSILGPILFQAPAPPRRSRAQPHSLTLPAPVPGGSLRLHLQILQCGRLRLIEKLSKAAGAFHACCSGPSPRCPSGGPRPLRLGITLRLPGLHLRLPGRRVRGPTSRILQRPSRRRRHDAVPSEGFTLQPQPHPPPARLPGPAPVPPSGAAGGALEHTPSPRGHRGQGEPGALQRGPGGRQFQQPSGALPMLPGARAELRKPAGPSPGGRGGRLPLGPGLLLLSQLLLRS